jgi:hypothetical protein
MSKATGANGEEITLSHTSEFLTQAAEEVWTKLKYHDEDVSAT